MPREEALREAARDAIAYAIARAPVPAATDTARDVADRLAPLVIESGYMLGREAALRASVTPPPLDVALSLLPTFEVGQVVGDLLPGRRRHDWCSVHGDIGPMESINGHARNAHGASSEAIRKARKTLKAVARLSEAHE